MKTVIQIILALAIIGLVYLIVDSVEQPIRFQKAKDVRYTAAITRLKDIRSAQVVYKSRYSKFTGDFDTLVNFIKTDSLKMVKKKGSLSDSLIEAGWTELKALKAGLISRDTIAVSVLDSLFSKNYPVDSICYVPFTDGKKFELGAGVVKTGSGVKVQVFEAKVLNTILLKGLDKQEVININDTQRKLERYCGLKVGSLTETNNNAGNWE